MAEVVVMLLVIELIAHHAGQERGESTVQLLVWDRFELR